MNTIAQAKAEPSLKDHADQLDQKWQLIRNVTEKLHALTDVELQLANAANYLEAFGHLVVGGYGLIKR